MPIKVNEETKEFHLFNRNISYIFRVLEKSKQLEHLYYGKKIKHRESFKHLIEREIRPSCNMFEGDHTSSLEHIKQEYPSFGTTDYRYPAHMITNDAGSHVTNFQFESYEIIQGKPLLNQLPATYVENESEAETIEITLVDHTLKSKLILSYSIYADRSVICRNSRFINTGEEAFYLNNAMSMNVDFPDDNYEMVHLAGAWAREAHMEVQKISKGIQSVYSTRGASSHVHNPFLALKRPDTTEHTGDVYGFSLVYSGNFLAQVEVDAYSVTRVMMGINPFCFKWKLNSKESFQTPECVMVFSDQGLNGMSQTFHELYRTRLVRGNWRDKDRPILINNWEATYFNFNEEKILTIAKAAKDLGIELFVLDDGWFGERHDDTSSLGDWFTNKEKLPTGIKGLSEKIDVLGLKFGLWFEPEMVCKGTKLLNEHPNWIIATPGRSPSHGRNQFILDFTREEVVDHIFSLMDEIITGTKISYIKWDMNRYITEAYSMSLAADQQGEVYHRYILGVYSLYERLIQKHPQILFESCAGGGARFDPGMLYYAPQAWASDDTDAVERLKIQYGTSMVYPLNSIGSHVSAVPNHQVGRTTPIESRASVAYFGTFGYELDVTKLNDEEKRKVKEQVSFFKEKRNLIRNGQFYRLQNPFESNEVSWMIVSEDQREAIVGYYKILAKPNDKYYRIKLKGLNPEKLYHIKERGSNHYGDELMNIGIILAEDYTDRAYEYWQRELPGDFSSEIFVLKEVETAL
ncbi:alpha-galactosidase [Bacillus subtilis]|uniref:alpha-galactosidase n=1 Tax=Bacillus subtilis TaxID=1423 RepID=UPI001C8DA510|nr:alpha-galactosidase [Bacillus subtilis]MBY0182516.1 alpha-galactosidase [Bacillus subtilis]MEC1007169.1 alpha-galactosidase [Bacillus subtilis]MEC1073609.1 alpha-galactosidase [Bacillus subtilis]MED1804114.1 alpha-galactosidase [Bacillus subtilis]UUH68574.1 alpha-galactosidase [Bacillus subtilis subsp. subtilis]